MKNMHECIECGNHYVRENDAEYCCDACKPIRRLRNAIGLDLYNLLKPFQTDRYCYYEPVYRVEGVDPTALELIEPLTKYLNKLRNEGRLLIGQLKWTYRHNKEELRENKGDPRCRFWHVTYTEFIYEKLFALLKKGFGDGNVSLKSFEKILEANRDHLKIFVRGQNGDKHTEQIPLDLGKIYQAMKDCEPLYKWASSFLKKAEGYNQEFLDHRCFYHKGKEDEASIFDVDRVRSILVEFYEAFLFLFGVEKDTEFWSDEQEDEFLNKMEREYESRKHKEVHIIHFGDKVYEA